MLSKNVSAQKIFLWNLLGSFANALLSVFLLLVVSRLLLAEESDLYSYAYALANLFSMIGLFQVRNLQATDIKQKYRFSTYLSARVLTSLLMLVTSFLYIMVSQSDLYRSLVIVIMCLYRCTDAVSDVFQGLFQQRERLDIAGRSLFLRTILMFLGFSLTLFLFRDLALALIVLVLLSALFILVFDVRQSLRFETWMSWSYFKDEKLSYAFQLLRESLPLFIIGFLVMYIYNQPKYAIDALTNEGILKGGAQTTFNILFMPTFVMNLLMLFFRPLMTQLSIYLHEHRMADFKRTQRKLVLYLAGANILCLLGSSLVGIPFLNIFYGVQLNQYWLAFMVLMLSGGLASFCILLDNFLTVLRYQKFLILPYSIAFLTSFLTANPLVRSQGVLGASLSFLLSIIIWLISSYVVYLYCKSDFYKKKKQDGHV